MKTKSGSAPRFLPPSPNYRNVLVIDLLDAQLVGGSLTQSNPVPGILSVNVDRRTENSVRLSIIGSEQLPNVNVQARDPGVVVSLGSLDPVAIQPTPEPTPLAIQPTPEPTSAPQTPDQELGEITVTADRPDTYNPPSASTATRTETPLRDIPQSIQVVPRQVLEDRNVRTVTEAVETVAGVLDGSNNYGAPGGTNIIRGFVSFDSGTLRNGLRDYNYYSVTPIGTIERIEVLRGPASVLFGVQEPGGVINVITRQPLDEPYYNLEFEAGNYNFYQSTIDFSGSLTADDSMLYRFIASYQDTGNYQDFVSSDTITIAPSITWSIGDKTDLNLSYEYVRYFADNPNFEVPLLSDGNFPPRDFYPSYPDLALSEITTNRIGATLNHRFSENWQLRNNLAITLNDRNLDRSIFNTVVDDQILTDPFVQRSSASANNYFGQIDLIGEFNTGSIAHQFLVGFDTNYFNESFKADTATVPDLNIFDPDYDILEPDFSPGFAFDDSVQSYGTYLQDQITLNDSLILLIGGRYDWITSETQILRDDTDQPVRNDGAFSPRVGLVYQPNDTVSIYASYNRAFKPISGFSINPDGGTFEPSRGTQYEIGTRADLLEGRLTANLAAYHLTRTNTLTPDPENLTFSIQTGEARSQGIELDVTGEILPGWNVILSYAYTDAEVTEDNTTPVGNQLDNVPFNQASLWTTYEIQEGDLRGLGFGLGLFYIGERQGDLANSFELPSYMRTDAAFYYRRDNFNAAINIRNLFDLDYASYSFGRTFIQRGAPFSLSGSIGWTF